jgi:hypothetical protein
MGPLDGNAVATALARYVRDFLPETAHGVTVIRLGTDDGALLGVYGKPGGRGRAKAELALYEALLAKAGSMSSAAGSAPALRRGLWSCGPAVWSTR